MVVSVPRELSSDHSAVLLLAESSGCITEADISKKLQWGGARPRRVLDELMQVKIMVWFSKCHHIICCYCVRCISRLTFCRGAVSCERPSQCLCPLHKAGDHLASGVLSTWYYGHTGTIPCQLTCILPLYRLPTGGNGVGGRRWRRTCDGGRRRLPGVLLPKSLARREVAGRGCRRRMKWIRKQSS